MTTYKRGLSALLLQRQFALRRYETAWMMLHKFRRVRAAMIPVASVVNSSDLQEREPRQDDRHVDAGEHNPQNDTEHPEITPRDVSAAKVHGVLSRRIWGQDADQPQGIGQQQRPHQRGDDGNFDRDAEEHWEQRGRVRRDARKEIVQEEERTHQTGDGHIEAQPGEYGRNGFRNPIDELRLGKTTSQRDQCGKPDEDVPRLAFPIMAFQGITRNMTISTTIAIATIAGSTYC